MNVRPTSSGCADAAASDISRAQPGDVIKKDKTGANNATTDSSRRSEGSHSASESNLQFDERRLRIQRERNQPRMG
jgi:hypothetical protein